MYELAVVSGKGGTGKTSVVASLAALAEHAVLADCDVEAADLDLILEPTVERREQFYSGHLAVIRDDQCIECGDCMDRCRFGAVRLNAAGRGGAAYWIDPLACEGCGRCVRLCPAEAIDFVERRAGEWLVSTTRCGPLVHAKLRIAEGNSGKLVAKVREVSQQIAMDRGCDMVIIDGPPGIGCPAIASLAGAAQALVVTEPTLSGEHDLARILELTRQMDVPAAVCVNKWDVNPSVAAEIERRAREKGAVVAGRICYDLGVASAQMQARATVETQCAAADDIREVWSSLVRLASNRGICLASACDSAGITSTR